MSRLQEALKIILFGSLARGEADVYSDLDLFVLMPPCKSGKEWMKIVYDRLERDVAADIIVYNVKEYEEMLPVSSFLQEIRKSGRVIFEQ